MADERNPFTLGPSAGRTRYSPDLQTRTPALQQPAPPGITGTDIVESLVAFSGVAANEYVKKVGKKIEEDKAVQISRALEGALPTDEATVAGYRAHVAVSIKGKVLEGQARLNQLAKERMTDDDWQEAIREEYRTLDSFLESTYERFPKDIELQKLAATAYREVIPQATAERMANKLQYEINDRINSATDVFMNAAALGGLSEDNPRIVAAQAQDMLKSLKLTPSQQDKALEQAIINTQSLDLIRVAKGFYGDRKTSLYDRSGKVQAAEQKAQEEKAANDLVDMTVQLEGIRALYLGDGSDQGSMTDSEMISAVKQMRKASGNRYPEPGFVRSLIREKQRSTAAYNIIQAGIRDFSNANVTNLDHLKPEERQQVIRTALTIGEKAAERAADKAGLEGKEREQFLEASNMRYEKYIGDNTVEKNSIFKEWVRDFTSLANANVPTITELSQTAEGKITQQLSPKASKSFKTLENLSDTAQRVYLEEVGGTPKSILERYLNFREIGRPPADALRLAQVQERMNIRPKSDDVVKAVDEAYDASKSWYKWDTNIPSSQSSWFRQRILEKVNSFPDPTTEPFQKSINNWIQKGWTRTDNGLMLEGSPQQLSYATHLHPDAFDAAFSYYVSSQSDTISRGLEGLGLSYGDVFPVINRKDGTMMLWSTFGPLIGTQKNLSELSDIYERGLERTRAEWPKIQEKIKNSLMEDMIP